MVSICTPPIAIKIVVESREHNIACIVSVAFCIEIFSTLRARPPRRQQQRAEQQERSWPQKSMSDTILQIMSTQVLIGN
jgi:hypothetical protein